MQIQTLFQNLGQNLSPINFLSWKLNRLFFYNVVDLCEVLNVFDRLSYIRNSINIDTQKSVKRYFPVDVSLSVHVTALVVTFLVLCISCFTLGQDLADSSVANFNAYLADDAIFSLTVAGTVYENNSLHYCGVTFPYICVGAVFVVAHQVKQVF